jgi:regulator of RNase E activity RraA
MNKKMLVLVSVGVIFAVLFAMFINANSYTYQIKQNSDGSVLVTDDKGDDVSGIWAWLSKYINLGGITGQATYGVQGEPVPTE